LVFGFRASKKFYKGLRGTFLALFPQNQFLTLKMIDSALENKQFLNLLKKLASGHGGQNRPEATTGGLVFPLQVGGPSQQLGLGVEGSPFCPQCLKFGVEL
jgi:hypothetical protein